TGQSCNTTKGTPCLQADILGDWREEVILWDYDKPSDIMIYTTTIASNYRVPCLMQDHNYRMAIAWQNTGYNQPPHLGYYLYDAFNNDPQLAITEGSLTQTAEIGSPIQPIKGTWDRCDDVLTAGFPAWMTISKDTQAKTFTITGTPDKAGTYAFKLATSGGTGTTMILNGSITVIETSNLTRVAHYSFDQIGGETVTNHVQGLATVHGAPTATEGKAAGAIQFNGTSDYLTQAAYDKIQLGSQSFSIELLFKSTDDAAYLLHKGSISATAAAGATGNWIGLEYKGGNLKFAIDDDVTKSEATAEGTPYFDGQWHHVVLVRDTDAKKLCIYVDGQLIAESSDDTGAVNDNNEDLVIANGN
ncbi:MAG: Por secretion system protein, partial [Duncaniella sp.]|nr:Por secretion system protein [Duncaniella sp.]